MRHDLIREFYQENRHALYTYACSISSSPASAEDAVHSTICRLLKKRVLPGNLKAYAYRCIRNAVIDDWRKSGTHRETSYSDQDHEQGFSPGIYEQDIETLLSELIAEERETIFLKVIHGCTFREISSIHRVPLHTAAARYRRGLQKLKALYQEMEDETA